MEMSGSHQYTQCNSRVTLINENNIGPSRKDDLISLFYMLLYLKDVSLPWTRFQGLDAKSLFRQVLNTKK